MGAGVVTVGRHQYAVGLYWENSPGGRIAQTAKEAARQPGQQADFFAVRGANKTERVAQFGLGQTSAGHKAGMPAFAACIANQQPGSWAGAFRLREGTVVAIVRDDLIVPDGDQFFLNESEARDRLLQEIGFGGLQRIYAPESWAIAGADTMPVSLLLDERRDVRLQAVEIPKKMIMIGGAAAVFLLIVLAGGWYYNNLQEEQDRERAAQEDALRRAQEAANRLLPGMSQKPQYPPPERKWEKQPPALAIVENCRAGLSRIPAAVNGWKLSQLKCDGNTITLGWTREKGFSRPPAPAAAVTDSGGSASLSIALPKLEPRGPENLVDPVEITRRYLAEDWQGTISRAPDDPPPPPPPGYQGTWSPPPPPWVKRSFTVTVGELPSSLPLYFGGLPGTVIYSLNYSGSETSGGWTVEGVIYENRV